jgi:hypothetical protein
MNLFATSFTSFENVAEKYRALVTRPILAIRDVYDIGYIVENKEIILNLELLNLILKKIKESRVITKNEFLNIISNLSLNDLNISQLDLVLANNRDSKKEIIKMMKFTKQILDVI